MATLDGVAFALGIISEYEERSLKIAKLFLFIPIISGLSILYEILAYMGLSILKYKEVLGILNGVGVWGTFGVCLTFLTLSFEFLPIPTPKDFEYSFIFPLIGTIWIMLSRLTNTPITIRDIWPLLYYNTVDYLVFLYCIIQYLREK